MGPHFDPEDIAQEVFIIAGRRLNTFNNTSRVTTWLYGIKFNVVRSFRRKDWRHHLFRRNRRRCA